MVSNMCYPNGGMTLALQGQGYSIRITEIEKNYIFRWNHCTPFSVTSTVFKRADFSRHFFKWV